MLRIASVAAFLLLAACSEKQAVEEQPNIAASEQPKPAAEVPALSGEWRVVQIEGVDAAGLGMAATFTGTQASLATGCLRRAWTYTQDRNMVSFKTSPGGSANCGRTPNATEETAYAALEGATIAIFNKEGKEASLSGGGGNLTLVRR